jgi:bacillithiol biosynthesis cysteine-adding enzyme BshC
VETNCSPITILPRLSRLFVDYCESRQPLQPFYSASPLDTGWASPADFSRIDRSRIADLLRDQNRAFGAQEPALANIERIRAGAGVVVTGQQVTLFGGPLFTLFKAATAIARAKSAGAVPVFWLASEDHDLAEADRATFVTRHALETLQVATSPDAAGRPVGGIQLGEGIHTVLDQAAGLLGDTLEVDWLREAYTPNATFASAFGRLIARIFAKDGLVVIDAAGRGFHALGAPVLRQAIERAGEFEELLHRRDTLLHDRGYHSQVLVAKGSSLLFLIDAQTGMRQALKRREDGQWTAGKRTLTTQDLLGILDTEPERLSPNALLRPVFQDCILPTLAYIGGPAEIAYFAQTQVLYDAILGRTTPVLPRLSATLVEPAIAQVTAAHEISLAQVFSQSPDEMAQRLGARAMPIEGKKLLSSTGQSLDAELQSLTQWMSAVDDGLGRAAGIAASKMRYQMNRLRRLAANYQLQKDASIRKHVDALYLNLFPEGAPQERVIAGMTYLARYGDAVIDAAVNEAAEICPGHREIRL